MSCSVRSILKSGSPPEIYYPIVTRYSVDMKRLLTFVWLTYKGQKNKPVRAD